MPDRNRTVSVEETWYVYIVQCADGSLYTGVAKDVEMRVSQHNAGKGAKYTRARLPVRLIHREPAADQGSAMRREYEIKGMTRKRKWQLVAG